MIKPMIEAVSMDGLPSGICTALTSSLSLIIKLLVLFPPPKMNEKIQNCSCHEKTMQCNDLPNQELRSGLQSLSGWLDIADQVK